MQKNRVKILTVIGARPQIIKSAVLNRLSRNEPAIEEILLHTGQHYDVNMSDDFFRELDIQQPKYNLGIEESNPATQVAKMIEGISLVIADEQPDWVLVYGDTNSTLAGAIAANKLGVKLAHVEAGLRSFNRQMPEEHNRIVADNLSDILFTPTQVATQHLEREKVSSQNIIQSGDVMYDLHHLMQAHYQKQELNMKLPQGAFSLVTIHRAENTDNSENLKQLAARLIALSNDIEVLWPLHPRTKNKLEALGMFDALSQQLMLIEPVSYLEMGYLLDSASVVITDSGGLQKEAYYHHKPCIVLRDETEWVELVEQGNSELSPASDPRKLADIFNEMKQTELTSTDHLYGDGAAAQRILSTLLQYKSMN